MAPKPEPSRIPEGPLWTLRILATCGVLLMAVVSPVAYWQLGAQRVAAEVKVKAEIKADLIGQRIAQNPQLWQFEDLRLRFLLSRFSGESERGVIRDKEGRVVVEVGPQLELPVVEVEAPLLDSGEVVGGLVLGQSVNGLAWRAAGLALAGVLLGCASYWLFISAPMRVLERTTQALQESEERLRLFVDGTNDYALVMLDPEGRVASWNEGARRIMGYEEEEILGRHFALFYGEEEVAAGKPQESLKIALRDGKYREEGERCKKNGGKFWTTCVITPLFDATGRLRGYSKIDRDITEYVHAEQIRASLEEQLHRSHRMEALGRMAGRIAHEINNVLQPVMSHSSLAAQACADNEVALGHLSKIKESVRHGREIVRSVLAVAGGRAMARQPCVLENEVARIMGLIGATVSRNITLESALEPTEGAISLSPSELFQILENLVANSADAIDGVGRISVSTNRLELDGLEAAGLGLVPAAYAELVVSDTGSGMDEATLVRAMDPFFTTKPVNKGSGLGLSTVRTLVESMGGRILITSSVGQGTRVRMMFPFERQA